MLGEIWKTRGNLEKGTSFLTSEKDAESPFTLRKTIFKREPCRVQQSRPPAIKRDSTLFGTRFPKTFPKNSNIFQVLYVF